MENQIFAILTFIEARSHYVFFYSVFCQ